MYKHNFIVFLNERSCDSVTSMISLDYCWLKGDIVLHWFFWIYLCRYWKKFLWCFVLHDVISCFLLVLISFLLAFLLFFFGALFKGGEERTIEFMERQGRLSSKTPLLEHGHEKGIIKHPFPMNYILKPWKLGQWFYQVVKFGIVQYVCHFSRNSIFHYYLCLQLLLPS